MYQLLYEKNRYIAKFVDFILFIRIFIPDLNSFNTLNIYKKKTVEECTENSSFQT